MYNEVKTSLKKHLDFVILDILAMEGAFFLAYFLRHHNFSLLNFQVYRTITIVIIFANLLACYIFNTMQDVLKRPWELELYATFKQCFLTETIVLFFLFITKTSIEFSRNTIIAFPFLYLLLAFIVRYIYKKILKRILKNVKNRKFLVITTYKKSKEVINKYKKSFNDIEIKGLAIVDKKLVGKKIDKYKVLCDKTTLYKYLLNEHIDEAFIAIPGQNDYKKELIEKINSMGIVIHVEIDYVDSVIGTNNKEFIEHIFDYTVLTCTVNTASSLQLLVKRLTDILVSIVGIIITFIFTIIIGPIIKLKSPGPIFFKQKRVGKNGKIFEMYKFRSMYVNADKDKQKLVKKSDTKSKQIFKMKNDPRIIPGIGNFIRNFSIDEFPQFINVFFGDMSLVGTRPPTIDEWEKYELHHRARLSIKPGITGLWQVSGRSDIKDFEDVVRLDKEYIKNFSVWLDVKILLKTFAVVFLRVGAR